MPAKSLELKHTIKLIQELDAEISEIENEIQSIMDEINSPILSILLRCYTLPLHNLPEALPIFLQKNLPGQMI